MYVHLCCVEKKINDFFLSFFLSFLCTPQPTQFLLVISLANVKRLKNSFFISVSSERLIGLREIFSADMMSHYFRGFEKTVVGGDIEKNRGE
jgi:hypothetical protein